MYLLDTDYAVLIQKKMGAEVQRLFDKMAMHSPSSFHYPIVAFHEQVLGANSYIARTQSTAQMIRGYEILSQILIDFAAARVLPYDQGAADIFVQLRKSKIRIGTMDLRIASIALSRNLTVLTRNLVDFQRIPGLKVEDWTVS